jgi:hypothetical protein
MTTSGLHGTVVARNDDDTVQLSIAPGVEVRWELAALRDLASLPRQFRSAHPDDDADDDATASDTPEGTARPRGLDLGKGDPSRGADPLP